MYSHFGLKEQGMMTAALILQEPADLHPGLQQMVMMLNDFTSAIPPTFWPSSKAKATSRSGQL
jgi:hypothetical protein